MTTVTGQQQLTLAESTLIDAAAADKEADLRGIGDGQEAVIKADVLRDLITGANPQWLVKDRIRMSGARVRGSLGLAGAELTHALRFTDCVFEDQVDLRLARARKPVEWDGGQTAAIRADELEADADLIIRNVTVTGLISLHWASVRGDLRLTGSHLVAPGGQVFYGKDLRVAGSLFLDGTGFRAEGEVCLRSAHVEGQINCRHASFSNPLGCAINADHLVADGELLCEEGFCSTGEVCLQWAKLRRLRATGGSFRSSTTYALHADALRAEAGVYLDRGFHATATVRLVGANITGELCCTEGFFDNPSGRALDAERIVAEDVYLDRGFRAHGDVRFNDAEVARQFNATGGEFRNERRGDDQYALNCDGLRCCGDVFLNDGFHAAGSVSLRGAEIKTELNCSAGSFTKPDGYALFADGMTTPGVVFLDREFRAEGEVRLARATVGRQLVCSGGAFSNQNGIALDMTGLISPGDVLLKDGFRATGEVRMHGADITRDLDFTGARLSGPKGLSARGMRVGCLIWKMDSPPEGPVDLSLADIGRLDDTWRSWPQGNYTLAGLTYGITVDGEMTVGQRIRWLCKTKSYSADAYQELVRSYALSGDRRSADRVAIACQRDLRREGRGNLTWPSRAWNGFIDLFVGYGYKLHRPFVILLITGLAGGFAFWAAQHANLIISTGEPHTSAMQAPPAYPPFYPFAYSFQLLIPGLDLRETANWLPDATKSGWGLFMMILTWMMVIFGWTLTTAVVAGITRLFRRR